MASALLLTTGCEQQDSPSGSEKSQVQLANEWIHQQMAEEYLYNMDVPALSVLNTKAAHEDFFASLLSSQEAKQTESGRQYFYSYLTVPTATKASTTSNSYGIFFMRYLVSGTQEILRVLYVTPNSAAEKSGVKRGDWLLKYNGNYITDHTKLIAGASATVTKGVLSLVGNQYQVTEGDSFTLQASTTIDDTPFLKESVIEIGGKRVGYLAYNSFSTGPNGFEDKKWDNELKQTFARFKSAGVTEFVLDLRYNGGGYISTCQLLSTMLGSRAVLGKTFSIQQYNPTLESNYVKKYGANHGVIPFATAADVVSYNLDLGQLYVIGTQFTASASELVINSLRAYMPVKLVGTKTEGKNVGSYEITNESKFPGLKLQPITLKIFNSKKESDYRNGFTPDLLVDELDDNQLHITLGELGNYQQEPLLQRALVDMGLLNPSVTTSSVGTIPVQTTIRPTGSHLSRPNEGLIGARPQE